MSILLSGSEQCPGDMLLILSHTWCSKQQSPRLPNKYSLFVHQAVAFYKGWYISLIFFFWNNNNDYIKVKIDKAQQNSRCRLRGDRDETINHISKCCKLAKKKKHKIRYDWVGKVVHEELCKFKFDHTKEQRLPLHLVVVAIEKRAFGSPSTMVANFYIKARIVKTKQNSKCRLCCDKDKTITHIISECSKLARREYWSRHEWVGKVIRRELCLKFEFDRAKKWYIYLQTPPLGQDMTQGQFLSGI